IYNNYIEIRDAHNEERQAYTAKAIWLRYWSGNVSIYNNTMIGYAGDNKPYPGMKSSVAVVRLGSYDDTNGPYYLYDNYIESRINTAYRGEDAWAVPLDLESDSPGSGATKYIYNNIIKGNDYLINFGGNPYCHQLCYSGYGAGNKDYLTGNTLILDRNAYSEPNSRTIYFGYYGGNLNLLQDTVQQGGANVRNITYSNDGIRELNISWTLTIRVVDDLGNPLSSQVDIKDRFGATAAYGTTTNGIYSKALIEVRNAGTGASIMQTAYSPYTVTVNYNGQIQTRSVTLNQMKTEIFTYTATPCINGQARNCTTIEGCNGTQICSSNTWSTCTDVPDDGCPAPSPSPSTYPSPSPSPSASASPSASPSPSISVSPSAVPSPSVSASPSTIPSASPSTLPCTENWSCTSWSACNGVTQTRTCIDSNACNTTINVPAESQSCSIGGNTGGSTGGSSGGYSSGSGGAIPQLPNPSPNVSPKVPLTPQQEFVSKVIEIEDSLPEIDFDQEGQQDIADLVAQAKLLQKQGKTEQALVLLKQAKEKMQTKLQDAKVKKADWNWLFGVLAIAVIAAIGIYYYRRR
ncbi:MAG: hypothetical protein V1835_01715, partial [Candidatus Micrarchaeota archaeon]